MLLNQPVKTGIHFISIPDNISVVGGEYNIKASYNDNISVKPGSYNFKVSKDGYISSDLTVNVSENNISTVCVSLNPQTDEAKKELSEIKDISSRQEAVAGCQLVTGSKLIEEEYPFINKLPIIDKYFNASSCNDSDGKIIICVSLVIISDSQKQRALSIIKEKGIDTDKVKIRFLSTNGD